MTTYQTSNINDVNRIPDFDLTLSDSNKIFQPIQQENLNNLPPQHVKVCKDSIPQHNAIEPDEMNMEMSSDKPDLSFQSIKQEMENEDVATAESTTNMMGIKDENLLCTFCDHIAKDALNLQYHVAGHALEKKYQAADLKCPVCIDNDQTFVSKVNLRLHCKKFHPSDYSKLYPPTESAVPKKASGTVHHCPHCRKAHSRRSLLSTHLQICKVFRLKKQKLKAKGKFVPIVIPKVNKNVIETSENKSHDPNRRGSEVKGILFVDTSDIGMDLKCVECGYECFAPFYLRKHIETHHLSTEVQCKFCDRKCKLPRLLKPHIKAHHPEEFKKLYSRPKKQIVDIAKSVDGDKKPRTSCQVCREEFKTQTRLVRHMTGHFAEPHCFVCNAEFVDMPGVRKHLKVYHGLTVCDMNPEQSTAGPVWNGEKHEEKPPPGEKIKKPRCKIVCMVCGKHYPSQKLLGVHMQVNFSHLVQIIVSS